MVAARALPAWYPACAARVVPTWYPACEQGMPQPGPSLRSKSGATQTGNQCRNRRRQSTIQATSNAIILKSDNQPTAANFSHSLQTPLRSLWLNGRMERYLFHSKEDDMELLKGKTAIVTGGTRGIGFAILLRHFWTTGPKLPCAAHAKERQAQPLKS